jgi:hypothetical protein
MTSAKELLPFARYSRSQHTGRAPSAHSARKDSSLDEKQPSRQHKCSPAWRKCYVNCQCLPTIRCCSSQYEEKPKTTSETQKLVDCTCDGSNEFKNPLQTCDSSVRSGMLPSIDSRSTTSLSTERKRHRPGQQHYKQSLGPQSNSYRAAATFRPSVLEQFAKKRRAMEQRMRRENQILLDNWMKERAARRQAAERKKPPFPAAPRTSKSATGCPPAVCDCSDCRCCYKVSSCCCRCCCCYPARLSNSSRDCSSSTTSSCLSYSTSNHVNNDNISTPYLIPCTCTSCDTRCRLPSEIHRSETRHGDQEASHRFRNSRARTPVPARSFHDLSHAHAHRPGHDDYI